MAPDIDEWEDLGIITEKGSELSLNELKFLLGERRKEKSPRPR